MKIQYLLIALLLSFFSLQKVYASPFDNQPLEEQTQIQTEQYQPSVFTKIWFQFMQLQKNLNQKMTHYMREIKSGSSSAFWLLILIAFLYGTLHAIGPGHGKLIVLSYFTSHEAKWGRGALMGFQITFMHVLSAVALVMLTDGIARHALGATPSKEIQIIKLISYGAITIVGCVMLWQIYHEKKKKSLQLERNIEAKESKSQWLLALSVGLNPCTGALLFLFYAMSKQMLFTGISIVLAMALGIAVTLSIIGLACILTRSNLSHFKDQKQERKLITVLHYLGADLIVIIGLSLFLSTIFKRIIT